MVPGQSTSLRRLLLLGLVHGAFAGSVLAAGSAGSTLGLTRATTNTMRDTPTNLNGVVLVSIEAESTLTASSTTTITEATLPPWFSNAKIAHAVLGMFAFLLFFPLGGILLKVWPHRHIVCVHAAIQTFSLTLYIVCVGMGLWMCSRLKSFDHFHTILGLIVFGLLLLQPLTKLHWLHSSAPRVKWFVPVHLWLGRFTIFLGILEGGLGFQVASVLDDARQWPKSAMILYGIVGGLVVATYTGVCVFWVKAKDVPKMAPPSPGALPEGSETAELPDPLVQQQHRGQTPALDQLRDVEKAIVEDSETESGGAVAVKVRDLLQKPERPVLNRDGRRFVEELREWEECHVALIWAASMIAPALEG